MELIYHRQITTQALQPYFTPDALEQVIRGNFSQDHLIYQVSHPHYHYDDSDFARGDAFLEEMRRTTLDALSVGDAATARRSFGRLTHTAQDFYAHSNYVTMWREQNPSAADENIAPQLASLLSDPRLHSGRLYYPLEILSFVPLLKPLVLPHLPRDSHAWMNKDQPGQPDFELAFVAARKRTEQEYHQLVESLSDEKLNLLTGHSFTTK